MNTRQLSQGMKPTLEFERMHTYKSFRQFPELRKSVHAIESIAFASADPLFHMRSGGIRRKKQHTSTHHLNELSQSSLSEVSSVMDDFRKIMIENRRKNMALSGARPVSSANNSLIASGNVSVTSGSVLTGHDYIVVQQQQQQQQQRQWMSQSFTNKNSNNNNQNEDFVDDMMPDRVSSPKQQNENGLETKDDTGFQRPPFPHQGTSLSISASTSQYYGDPLLRANDKLKKIALSFDSTSYNSHLAGFQGAKLTKKDFSMLLRRCLNIVLRTAELDAIFTTMDADNSGLVDGVEFIRYFFHLGNEAKALINLETKERQRKQQQRMKRQKEKALLKEQQWQKSQIASFHKVDFVTAMQKLRKAAFWYDPNNPIDHTILHRLRAFLSPFDFQQQVQKCFMAQGMRLNFTGPELAALIYEYRVKQPDNNGNSNSNSNNSPHNSSSMSLASPLPPISSPHSTKPKNTDNSTGTSEKIIGENNQQISPAHDNSGSTKMSNEAMENNDCIKMTEAELDGQVDGYAFVTQFVHLSQAVWQEHHQEQDRLQYRRQRVLEMGQHTDIMPKCLGR